MGSPEAYGWESGLESTHSSEESSESTFAPVWEHSSSPLIGPPSVVALDHTASVGAEVVSDHPSVAASPPEEFIPPPRFNAEAIARIENWSGEVVPGSPAPGSPAPALSSASGSGSSAGEPSGGGSVDSTLLGEELQDEEVGGDDVEISDGAVAGVDVEGSSGSVSPAASEGEGGDDGNLDVEMFNGSEVGVNAGAEGSSAPQNQGNGGSSSSDSGRLQIIAMSSPDANPPRRRPQRRRAQLRSPAEHRFAAPLPGGPNIPNRTRAQTQPIAARTRSRASQARVGRRYGCSRL
ncbi:hypothetical protein B0H63DRAFT_483907 [Podospora didyma]|uniref:Uncharacterized protein n=1 Tax=Podospora didyma TaxID=330526 RepID=A0AAE0KA02_9PEZI|nr:hypothetical protein B0H63DRAFT_483907 [Podospora didyma]